MKIALNFLLSAVDYPLVIDTGPTRLIRANGSSVREDAANAPAVPRRHDFTPERRKA